MCSGEDVCCPAMLCNSCGGQFVSKLALASEIRHCAVQTVSGRAHVKEHVVLSSWRRGSVRKERSCCMPHGKLAALLSPSVLAVPSDLVSARSRHVTCAGMQMNKAKIAQYSHWCIWCSWHHALHESSGRCTWTITQPMQVGIF